MMDFAAEAVRPHDVDIIDDGNAGTRRATIPQCGS
jgi:hypothetical protein